MGKFLFRVICLLLFVLNVDGVAFAANLPKIEHVKNYENKGTRSEIVHGLLEIGGYEVPEKFKKLTYNGKTFEFKQRSNEWGGDGYMQAEFEPVVESEELLKLEMLQKGFYLGSERLKNTPADWVFVRWGDGKSAFVGWNKFYALYGEHDVPDISRRRMLNLMPLQSDPSMRKKIKLK